MNKKEKIKRLDTIIEKLNVIKNVWIPEYINNLLKNYTLCKNCNKYFKKEDYKDFYKVENYFTPTYIDYGYGEDNEYEYVDFLVKYSVCPNCKNKEYKSKMQIKRK